MSISISGNGSITGVLTSYTFDKSVSVGGTLTYEDVTNVDSVGIITAQSGIELTSGVLSVPDGSESTPSIQFNGSGTDTGFYSPAADQLALVTNGTGRLFVDSSGGVGVGASSISAKLHIIGGNAGNCLIDNDGSQYTQLLLQRNSTVNTGGDLLINGTAGEFQIRSLVGPLCFHTSSPAGTNVERLRIDSSGRLLVGVSSASGSSYLHVQGRVSAITEYAGISLRRGSLPSGASQTLGVINFTDNSENIGAQIFAESDAGSWTSGSNHRSRLIFATTADGAPFPTERMRINRNGLVSAQGIYDITTAGSANVNVGSSGELQRSTSSIKYKTNVETIIDDYSDVLLNCRPVWYRSTCESDNPDHSWWGFIAEEVAEIDPRLVHWKTTAVTYDENGSAVETPCDPEPEGVQYDRFVPHLLNLIKRQKQQIEAMEARLTAAGI